MAKRRPGPRWPAFLAVLALASPAGAQAVQTKDQQRCLNALNGGFAKVAKARGRALAGCVKARGKGDSATACVAAVSPKVDKARAKLASAEAKRCGLPPDFGATDATRVGDAAVEAADDWLSDLFGSDLDAALSTKAADSASAACQAAAAKAAEKCQRARLKEFNRCKKAGLKDGSIQTSDDLAPCVGADPKGKVARACGAIADKAIAKKCAGAAVDLASAFPGCDAASEAGLATCANGALECRSCEGARAADSLLVGCATCAPEPVAFVPAGASATPIEVTVQRLPRDGFPDAEQMVADAYVFGPEGTVFDVPVTIAIPLDDDVPPDSNVSVVHLNETTGQWEALPASNNVGPIVLAQVDHFSTFSAHQSPGPGCFGHRVIHTPGATKALPGVRTIEHVIWAGTIGVSIASEWTVTDCDVAISGPMDTTPAGDGAWIDYSQGGGGALSIGMGGFSLGLRHRVPDEEVGPHFGLADPCYAPLGVYQYQISVGFGVDCVDLCADPQACDDGNPCTDDDCDPVTGACENTPTSGACGSQGGGLCVRGLCMVEVPMNQGTSGDDECADEGLTCLEIPALDFPEGEVCLAFHPTARETFGPSGWKQSVLCAGTAVGEACGGQTNVCWDCPFCLDDQLDCSLSATPLIDAVFASCGSPP